jgi:hypothetical protein
MLLCGLSHKGSEARCQRLPGRQAENAIFLLQLPLGTLAFLLRLSTKDFLRLSLLA